MFVHAFLHSSTLCSCLSSGSRNWLCLAERESFQGPTFEANLYYTTSSRTKASTSEDVRFDGGERRHVSETRIPSTEVTGWRKELEVSNWVSLNRTLVEKKFACLLEDVSLEDFALHLTSELISSLW